MEYLTLNEIIDYLILLDKGELHLDFMEFLEIEIESPNAVELMNSFLALLLNEIPEFNWDIIRRHSAFKDLSKSLSNVKIEQIKDNVMSLVNSYIQLYSFEESKSIFKWSPYIYRYLVIIRNEYYKTKN